MGVRPAGISRCGRPDKGVRTTARSWTLCSRSHSRRGRAQADAVGHHTGPLCKGGSCGYPLLGPLSGVPAGLGGASTHTSGVCRGPLCPSLKTPGKWGGLLLRRPNLELVSAKVGGMGARRSNPCRSFCKGEMCEYSHLDSLSDCAARMAHVGTSLRGYPTGQASIGIPRQKPSFAGGISAYAEALTRGCRRKRPHPGRRMGLREGGLMRGADGTAFWHGWPHERCRHGHRHAIGEAADLTHGRSAAATSRPSWTSGSHRG